MAKTFQHKREKDILRKLKEGDEASFDVIYWKYSAWIYNFAYSLLFDKVLAEDLTQTVFLRIWEKRELIDPEGSFESYLFTIARNLAYKETEKKILAETLIDSLTKRQQQAKDDTEEQLETESLQMYIDSLINQLPEARRKIYQMSRMEHLSNKEIAAQLSISEKTVETQLYRSLQFLRQKLADDSGLLLLMAFLFTTN